MFRNIEIQIVTGDDQEYEEENDEDLQDENED